MSVPDSYDPRTATGDLGRLNDSEFRAVVNADLRRKAGVDLPTEVSAALRSPEYVERWFSMLCRIVKSVDGQLASKANDVAKNRALIQKKLLEERVHLADARDSADLTRVAHFERKVLERQAELEALSADAAATRAKSLRFKTAAEEAMLEARFLRDEARGNVWESAMADERNYWAGRARELLEAIEEHRRQLFADDIEPGANDHALWAVLSRS